ncbi:MAG TPA: 3-keto-5-aminohexanoate cleavage protein [Syntrophorhabdales bacterium]|nr:3-keto-5-aminohexanoate cleavage protein [Syntrophorhabdales bacterium]
MAKRSSTVKVFTEMTQDVVSYMFPVEKEPKILTMDKPLMIESACPGWQTGGKRFPAIPISIKDQIKEQVESVNAGAVIVHVHPRDPKTGNALMKHSLLAEVLEGIFAEAGDFITTTHSWFAVPDADIDFVRGTQELLELGKGNKYVQGTLVVPIGYRTREHNSFASADATIKGVQWCEAHGVKPIYQSFDTYSHLAFKRFLFDSGVAKWQPNIVNIQIGKHESHVVNKDPWSYLQLMTCINMIKENIPDAVLGVYPGGRNWLPMVTMGILMGADIVRVGVEDCYWMYPHKDELIKKHSDVVKLTVDLARMHGRRVVTDAKEARKILGMKLTSKL